MYVSNLIAIAGVWTLVVVSPGPNFLATVRHAMARSRRDGIAVATGIALATALWVTFSLVGLALLFSRISWLVEAVRLAGGCYLAYLGLRSILNASRPLSVDGEHAERHGRALMTGFMTNIGNPKSAVFWSSLFAVLLPNSPPLWFDVTSVTVVVAISFFWYATMACLFSAGLVAALYGRAKRWLDRLAGCLFIGLGIRLATSR